MFGLKKLFGKGFAFGAIILAVCAGIVFLSTRDFCKSTIARWTASEEFMEESGLLPKFDSVRQEDGTTRLILGDSICNQMFTRLSGYNPETSFQATNAAFMITGQYLLLEEYLKYHTDVTDVFLVMHPMPLTRTFDTEWSYRYGVMTYVEAGVLDYLDENTPKAMAEVYGGLFLKKGAVRLVEDSPLIRKLYLSYIYANCENYVQSSPFEIADQYVKKMYDLCEAQGARLHLYSAPVAEYFREQVEELEQDYDGTWMSSQYPDYFHDILYYPDEWTSDMSHFDGEHAAPESLDKIIEEAYGQTELFRSLRFEDRFVPEKSGQEDP